MSTPAEAVRLLLTHMGEEFGEHLCSLLLAGYEEDRRVRCRRIIITLSDSHTVTRQRYLKVAATNNSFLPYKEEPLVLLALLRLLFQNTNRNTRRVSFTHESILNLLGWPDFIGTRTIIDQAVARYFNLYFQPIMTLDELIGQSPIVFTHRECLLSEYGFVEEASRCNRVKHKVYGEVAFNLPLIEQMRRKSLFGIDWGTVQSITYLIKNTSSRAE